MIRLTLVLEIGNVTGLDLEWKDGGENAVRKWCEFDMEHGGYLVGDLIQNAVWKIEYVPD